MTKIARHFHNMEIYELSKKDTSGTGILALYSRNVKLPEFFAKLHFSNITEFPDNSLTLKNKFR